MAPSPAPEPWPTDVDGELDRITTLLIRRLDGLSVRVTEAIQRDVEFYATTDVVTAAEIEETIADNFARVIQGLRGNEDFDTGPARVTGSGRAAAGVPLAALMHAYRIGFQIMWAEFRQVAEAHPQLSRRALLDATARMWLAEDRFISDMAVAHREQTTGNVLDDAAERAALTEHLLEGRITSTATLWEVAAHLRIPTRGPYLAVAAAPPSVGKQALPGIESRLRAIDLHSAWRLLPDEQIGLVHVPTVEARRTALALLGRTATGRVGVSAAYPELADTPQSLRYARIALNSPGTGLTEFDASVLGIAAVSAPAVTTDLARTVLRGLYSLSAEDRRPLFDTFRAWVDAGGSVSTTAEALFVHRNTVRHRLRRIEELTGRSTTAPRELAELCLAFEVDTYFPVSPDSP
ncbi:helix-turn-helix domain-containing protein [Gordonia sp. ABSL1-1]|uniref:PucR family transcriptional regulator n=1 Tax=Gordonia sp. ABSL1-1 TaxID=3053923 RepID=UPI0025742E0A|nr:helix-turn-helix domain-containing protein [Gordonia sp. ABSL1-1]MDL9936333.1 helix-turn-helix domain-containing protein [Gordonia sp. ABSL1-1]